MTKKRWSLWAGFVVGLVAGLAIWWNTYNPNLGVIQNPQLIVVPSALGVWIFILRNNHYARRYSKNEYSDK